MKRVHSFSILASLLFLFIPHCFGAYAEQAAQIGIVIQPKNCDSVKSGQLAQVTVKVTALMGQKSVFEDTRLSAVADVDVNLNLCGGGFFASGCPNYGSLKVESPHEGVWNIGNLPVGQSAELDLFYRAGLNETIVIAKAHAYGALSVYDSLRVPVIEGAKALSKTFSIENNVFTEISLETIAEYVAPAIVKIQKEPIYGNLLIRDNKTDNPVFVYRPENNFVGTDSFMYQLVDADGSQSNIGTISLGITNPVEQQQETQLKKYERVVAEEVCTTCGTLDCVVCPTNAVILEDEKYTIVINCPCADITITRLPAHGSVEVILNKKIIYTPTLGYIGEDSFVYEVCLKDACLSTQANIEVIQNKFTQFKAIYTGQRSEPLRSLMATPTAQNDCVVTCQGKTIEIPVLANDMFEPPASLSIVEEPASGQAVAVVNATDPQTISYIPDITFFGADSFVYKLCDATGFCDTASVCVTVLSSPVLTDTSVVTCKNEAIMVDVLLSSTADVNEISIKYSPAHGQAVVNADGTITYTPDQGYTGTDQFVVQASNDDCCTAFATVLVQINGAQDDDASTCFDTPITIDVLANDTYSPPATVTVVDGPAFGITFVNGNNSITYTPNNGYSGQDQFVYQLQDATDCVSTATVSIVVAEFLQPIAVPDFAQACQRDPVVIDVLANDLNIQPDDVVTVISQPVSGKATATVNPDRTITYMLTDTTFTGIDNFIYQVCNPQPCCPCCTSASVMVTVNQQPVANNDMAFTCENNTRIISVLENDTNLLNAVVTIDSPPSHGAAVVNADNTITYIPNMSFMGSDSFVYRVTNNMLCSDSATVSIITTSAPMANSDSVMVPSGAPTVINVLANDVFVPPATLTITTTPANGTALVNMGSVPTITYTSDVFYTGTDSFSYALCDATGCCSDAALVSIGVTMSVIARSGCQGVVANRPTVVDLNTVIVGDTLPASCEIITQPSYGTIVPFPELGTCIFLYTPDQGFTGIDMFEYQITDNQGNTTQAEYKLTVGPQNALVNALQNNFCTSCTAKGLPKDCEQELRELKAKICGGCFATDP